MMTEIAKDEAGNPWWVAKDVCEVFGLLNITEALRSLDDDEKAEFNIPEVRSDGVTQRRNYRIVNEPGLYALIGKSRKPEARAFKRWITHEVLPSIRKDGGYLHTTPDMSDDEIMARAVLLGHEKIQMLQAKVEELAPKAERFDNLLETNGMTNLQNLGKILGYKSNKILGALRAICWLSRKRRKNAFTNEPCQEYIQKEPSSIPYVPDFHEGSPEAAGGLVQIS